jgi:hydrogen peroxide-dependent heme synthase
MSRSPDTIAPMNPTHPATLPVAAGQLPAVPLTLEGYATLHQMMRFRWTAWRALAENVRREIAAEAAKLLGEMEGSADGQSALFSLLGHKGDLMLVHFRELRSAQSGRARPGAASTAGFSVEPTTSYLSVIELGLYESSLKTYKALAERGVEPHSEEWNKAIAETIARQKEAMKPRLFPAMPPNRYVCFYPMDRRRGEDKNWYTLPMEERQRQMNEHGLVGRRYAGEVKQIITGSIGFDDWEWGVDLFADDPLVFKKLIYEMRFDHVSAVYALFGSFYIGLRCPADRLYDLLEGNLPAYSSAASLFRFCGVILPGIPPGLGLPVPRPCCTGKSC